MRNLYNVLTNNILVKKMGNVITILRMVLLIILKTVFCIEKCIVDIWYVITVEPEPIIVLTENLVQMYLNNIKSKVALIIETTTLKFLNATYAKIIILNFRLVVTTILIFAKNVLTLRDLKFLQILKTLAHRNTMILKIQALKNLNKSILILMIIPTENFWIIDIWFIPNNL